MMSRKRKIFDVVLMVLSALFMAVKTVSEKNRLTDSAERTE